MTTIKAIETAYADCRFRSRLEARWAVLFDALNIVWEYEKEGFDLGSDGYYLPDFWLPHPVEELANDGWGLWCEIKPIPATETEMRKAIALAAMTKHNVLIFQGRCGQTEYEVTKISATHFDPPKIFTGLRFRDIDGYIHLVNDAGFGSFPASYAINLRQAFRIARSARFEHGEKPSIRYEPAQAEVTP